MAPAKMCALAVEVSEPKFSFVNSVSCVEID